MQEQKPNKSIYKNKKATVSRRKLKKNKLLKDKRLFIRKLHFLLLIFVLLFLCLIGRMFYLQVIASDDLTRRALKQMTKTEKIKSDRGLIYDRKGKKLVSNVSKSRVLIDGKLIKNNKDSIELTKKIKGYLSKSLNIKEEKIQEAIEAEKVKVIAKSIDRTKALEIEKIKFPGIITEDFEARSYPYSNLASHIIGFTDQEGKGLYGIENFYDNILSGVAGKKIVFKDTKNQKMPGTETKNSTPREGLNAILTISEPIQRSAEEIIKDAKKENKAKRISAIVQDTKSGEIIAMASTGSYDLNSPREPQNFEQRETWKNLTEEQKKEIWYDNWRDFCVSDIYEPGSTFKTITAAAALEENSTNLKKHYYCTGYIRDLKGITITCTSLPNPHGDIIMSNAFAQSCNTTFVNIARDLGKEDFQKYIEAFGFGKITGIDLPAEERGIIPKDASAISDVSLATMSYGHGIAVTPIQMITAISAVANGGKLMQPYIVSAWSDSNGEIVKENTPVVKRQVVSQKTSDSMRELMGLVVEEGTGSLGRVEGYKVGGKTGTADKVSETGGYEKGKYISSFVSVAPLEDPKFTVLVIVEEPDGDYYGATVAAPINSKILESALKYSNIPKSDPDLKKIQKKVLVPDVRNLLLEDAGRTLSNSSLKFNAASDQIRDLSIVSGQSPAAGTEVDEGTIIDLVLDPNDSNKKKIPKLLGKTEEEVKSLLKKSGFSYVMEGNGEVIEQNPKGGEVVSEKTKIEIILSPPLEEKDDKKKDSTENNEEDKLENSKEKNVSKENQN